jgi:hypothetical protein
MMFWNGIKRFRALDAFIILLLSLETIPQKLLNDEITYFSQQMPSKSLNRQTHLSDHKPNFIFIPSILGACGSAVG